MQPSIVWILYWYPLWVEEKTNHAARGQIVGYGVPAQLHIFPQDTLTGKAGAEILTENTVTGQGQGDDIPSAPAPADLAWSWR